MALDFQWMTRIGVTWCVAAGLTGGLYLVTHNPWASVFACGAALGWVLLDHCQMCEEEQRRRAEVAELEKQVVSLRSTMQEMAVMHEEQESGAQRVRSRRRGLTSSRSSGSMRGDSDGTG